MIYEEATAMLYGIHTFHFHDDPHHEKKFKVFELNVSVACCDYTSSHAFLVFIKERNRLKIRNYS